MPPSSKLLYLIRMKPKSAGNNSFPFDFVIIEASSSFSKINVTDTSKREKWDTMPRGWCTLINRKRRRSLSLPSWRWCFAVWEYFVLIYVYVNSYWESKTTPEIGTCAALLIASSNALNKRSFKRSRVLMTRISTCYQRYTRVWEFARLVRGVERRRSIRVGIQISKEYAIPDRAS